MIRLLDWLFVLIWSSHAAVKLNIGFRSVHIFDKLASQNIIKDVLTICNDEVKTVAKVIE